MVREDNNKIYAPCFGQKAKYRQDFQYVFTKGQKNPALQSIYEQNSNFPQMQSQKQIKIFPKNDTLTPIFWQFSFDAKNLLFLLSFSFYSFTLLDGKRQCCLALLFWIFLFLLFVLYSIYNSSTSSSSFNSQAATYFFFGIIFINKPKKCTSNFSLFLLCYYFHNLTIPQIFHKLSLENLFINFIHNFYYSFCLGNYEVFLDFSFAGIQIQTHARTHTQNSIDRSKPCAMKKWRARQLYFCKVLFGGAINDRREKKLTRSF